MLGASTHPPSSSSLVSAPSASLPPLHPPTDPPLVLRSPPPIMRTIHTMLSYPQNRTYPLPLPHLASLTVSPLSIFYLPTLSPLSSLEVFLLPFHMNISLSRRTTTEYILSLTLLRSLRSVLCHLDLSPFTCLAAPLPPSVRERFTLRELISSKETCGR